MPGKTAFLERMGSSPAFAALASEALARDAEDREARRAAAARKLAELPKPDPPRERRFTVSPLYRTFAGIGGYATGGTLMHCPREHPEAASLRAAIRTNAPAELIEFIREVCDIERAVMEEPIQLDQVATGFLSALGGGRLFRSVSSAEKHYAWLATIRRIRDVANRLVEVYQPRAAVLVEIDRLRTLLPSEAVRLLEPYRARQRAGVPEKLRATV